MILFVRTRGGKIHGVRSVHPPNFLPRYIQANNAIQPYCADALIETTFSAFAFTFLSPITETGLALQMSPSLMISDARFDQAWSEEGGCWDAVRITIVCACWCYSTYRDGCQAGVGITPAGFVVTPVESMVTPTTLVVLTALICPFQRQNCA